MLPPGSIRRRLTYGKVRRVGQDFRSPAVGTSVGKPTLRAVMDQKTINLWRQIEDCRRGLKRALPPQAIPKPINDN